MELHFRAQLETEVFVSQAGYIVIRQNNWPDPEQRVLLSPNQANALLGNLDDLLVDAEYLFESNGGDNE